MGQKKKNIVLFYTFYIWFFWCISLIVKIYQLIKVEQTEMSLSVQVHEGNS